MSSSGNIIKLNIGGTQFQTSKSTLTKYDGMLKVMMETEIPVIKDDSGTIFIDRSPKHFDLILNFMRNGKVPLPKSEIKIEEIKQEAEFYMLDGLVKLCDAKISLRADSIELNIGGTVFQTCKSTLTKFNGFFKTMLETGIPLEKYESETIFIDRPSKHFELILNFMRYRKVALPEKLREVKEVEIEAQYYQLKRLVNLCSAKLVASERIKLNIGGTIFETKKSTLILYTEFFRKMFSDNAQIPLDDNGCIFIDQSPKYFDIVLLFITGNRTMIPDRCVDKLKGVLSAAGFFGTENLYNYCREQLGRLNGGENTIPTYESIKQKYGY